MLKPHTDGGADIRPPLRFLADSEKTAASSAAKFGMTIPSSFYILCAGSDLLPWKVRSLG